MWMGNPNFTCDLYYEKFPFALMPTNPRAPANNVGLFLNPLASWLSVTTNESLNQVVSLETYNRLVRQELNQPFSSTSSSTGSSNAASNANFDQYYHNFNDSELKEINVSKQASEQNKCSLSLNVVVKCFLMLILIFKALTVSIDTMLDLMDAKDDCFTMGILSSIVANELNKSSDAKLRRKV